MKRTFLILGSLLLTLAFAIPTMAQNPLAEALKVPGAKPTLPVSLAKKPFDNAFIAEAHKYWGNFHWQMGKWGTES